MAAGFHIGVGGFGIQLEVADERYGAEVRFLLESFQQCTQPTGLVHRLVLTSAECDSQTGDDSRHDLPPLSFQPSTQSYSAESGFYRFTVQTNPALTSMHVTEKHVTRWVRKPVTKTFLRYGLAVAVAHFRGILVHGCAMVPPGATEACLFVGRSGAGKTTMRQRLSSWAALGDDTVLLRYREEDGQFLVSGTPVPGKEHLSRDGAGYPLGHLFFLEPGADSVTFETLSSADCFRRLMAQTFCAFTSGPLIPSVLDTATHVASSCPAHVFASGLDHSVEPLLISAVERAA